MFKMQAQESILLSEYRKKKTTMLFRTSLTKKTTGKTRKEEESYTIMYYNRREGVRVEERARECDMVRRSINVNAEINRTQHLK